MNARDELPYMQLPQHYVRVKIKGTKGPVCICDPRDVADMTDDPETEYDLEDVWMTQAQVEALTEFEGF
jgi:hypothetical protein